MTFNTQHMLTATIGSLKLTNLRMQAVVTNVGGMSATSMELSVYGVTLSQMNQLSNVGSQWTAQRNIKVTLQADGTQVFVGTLRMAMVDGASQPDVCFRVSGIMGAYADVTPAPPTSVKGPADVVTLITPLAKQAGFTLESNGVNVKLSSPYFSGSIGAQIKAIAQHAGCEILYEGAKIVIVPPGKARQGVSATLSRATGMVGYPSFSSNYVIVKSIFNPAIKVFGYLTIKSDLTAACGTFQVIKSEHMLECLTPRGQWFTVATCQANVSGKPEPATDNG